jgi:hypothetical protein
VRNLSVNIKPEPPELFRREQHVKILASVKVVISSAILPSPIASANVADNRDSATYAHLHTQAIPIPKQPGPSIRTPIPNLGALALLPPPRPAFLGRGTFGGRWATRAD